jgi:outer membrane protein
MVSSLSFLTVAGCVMPAQAPLFDPHTLDQSERAASADDPSQPLYPLSTTQEDPLGGTGSELAGTAGSSPRPAAATTGPSFGADNEPILRLSLQDVIQRAVLYNHDVKVAGYQPAIDASRVVEAEANFDPVLFGQVGGEKKDDENGGTEFTNPTTGLGTTSFFDKDDTYSGEAGIKRNLESGGQVEAKFDTSYNLLIPQRFVDNPFYQNQLTLQLTQPLLRNFGADVNEARIVIDRNNARVSLLEFRKALEDNVSKTEEAYWQLVNAQQNVEIEESTLRENESAYKALYNRLNQRLVSSLEVSQVQTSLDSRRASLIRARADARNLSDQLKQLMNDPNLPVSSPALIVPTDTPVQTAMEFDIEDQINSAVDNRFEIGEQLLKIDVATVTYNVARNNTLPKLDLTASVSPLVVQPDFAHAMSEEIKFPHWEYGAQLQLEIPIGNREALAILRRTELQRMQAIEQYSAVIAQVSLDVREAAREVETNYELIDINRQSRLAAERALHDVVLRQQRGAEAITPEFVQLRLELADRLAQSQEAENQALATYNIALERLERAKGTLLRYNNVVMQEEPYKNQGLLK